MSTTTTDFGLILPDGTDPISRSNDLNANLTKIETKARTVRCTSGTRPSSPFKEQTIFETDTMLLRQRNATNTGWVTIASLAPSVTSSTRPSTPDASQLHYESDTNALLVRNSTNVAWMHPSIPVVSSTATIITPQNNQVIFDSTLGGLRRYNSGTWEIYHPNTTRKFKPATESVTSSTTLQNDDVFSFTVAANASYELHSFIPYDGAADPAGGLKMQFTGPAGCSLVWANYGVNSGALSSYNVVIEVQSAGSPRSVGTNAATVMSCRPTGSLVTAGTAGTLQFLWAQTTSNATPTRIIGGAWMELIRVA